MADWALARDEDRLPWLEPFGESERGRKSKRKRKTASGAALVALMIAFFGVGLAVAFSLGYRFASSPAGGAVASGPRQAARSSSVEVPLAPPVPLPKVELVPPPVVAETPSAVAPEPMTVEPVAPMARPTEAKAKAKKRYKRRPILRPFVNIKKRPVPATAPQPFRWQASAPVAVGPKGQMVQLGSYSTQSEADQAWRSIVWRYPYLRSKPRVVVPTPPVGGYRYYRLRLGTETQAQSLVICQHLRARGQSCIVIY